MKQRNIQRREIYASGSSDSWLGLNQLLEANLYASATMWRRFLLILLPVLGIGFVVSGVSFFFAYNWDEIPGIVKLSMVASILLLMVCMALLSGWNILVKRILLTGAAFMVGVLFAVFGQIYQTGANSADMFILWTLFITVWVAVGGFAPLWFLWIMLVNLSMFLYFSQYLSYVDVYFMLVVNMPILFCAICVAVVEYMYIIGRLKSRPAWLVNILVFIVISLATGNLIINLVASGDDLTLAAIVALVLFGGGAYFGFVKRYLFYIAVISCCALAIVVSIVVRLLVDIDKFPFFLLLIGLMLIGGTVLIVKMLMHLKKLWNDDNEQ